MKWFLFGVFFLLLRPVCGEVTTLPAVVAGTNVNLRSGPFRHAEIVGQLRRGDEVRVVLTDGEWSAIVPPAGMEAWVARSYLREGNVISERVNIRSGPSVAYAVLLTLGEGEEVVVLDTQAAWAKIELPATARLWVNARYLSTGAEPPPPELPVEYPGEKTEKTASAAALLPPATPVTPSAPAAGGESRPSTTARPPLPAAAPRSAVPAHPGPRSYTGIIRRLDQPISRAGRDYEYELATDRHDQTPQAFLTGGKVDLAGYRFRPVRIWAETIEAPPGHPLLLEVKGVGFLW